MIEQTTNNKQQTTNNKQQTTNNKHTVYNYYLLIVFLYKKIYNIVTKQNSVL